MTGRESEPKFCPALCKELYGVFLCAIIKNKVVTKYIAEIYIEKRDDEGDYAVRRRGAERASATAPTQAKAIRVAEKMFPGVKPDVERVRHTSKGHPDQWRKK